MLHAGVPFAILVWSKKGRPPGYRQKTGDLAARELPERSVLHNDRFRRSGIVAAQGREY